MALSLTEQITNDRCEKWRRFRERNGMTADAPFVGKHPLLRAYEEALDVLNYLGETRRRIDHFPANSLPWDSVWRAEVLAMQLAMECLRVIEALREQEVKHDVDTEIL